MQKPIILTEGKYSKNDLENLKSQAFKQKDIYKSQLTEIFEITNADLLTSPDYDQKLDEFISGKSSPDPQLRGNYVFYPWSGLLLHMVPEEELIALRTNRTRNLVNSDEQQKLREFTAGVAGLSFGNGIVLSLVYGGASDTIKVADRDIFETTNLNRVRVGLPSVEEPKVDVTSREIYEINPYAEVEVFNDGLTEDNIGDFIGGKNKLKIVFDVVDDLSMKVRLRLAAREAGIPVVMLTSLEDSVLVDVERFDLDPSAEIFHGLLGSVTDELLSKELSEPEKAKYAMRIVGPDVVSYRNLLSLSDIGTKLVSRPHLYGTVSIVCGLAAYILKRIALGEDMPSLRRHLKFNELLEIQPNKEDTPEARQEILSKLMQRN